MTVSRRNLLKGLSLAFIPKVQNNSPVPNAPPPKFWFGDRVSYCWVDDDGNSQDEFGQVTGLSWHPLRKHWEYSVLWLTSTVYTGREPGSTYPSFDHELIYETEIERAYLGGELCKL